MKTKATAQRKRNWELYQQFVADQDAQGYILDRIHGTPFGCWDWGGLKNNRGYGVTQTTPRLYAHRLSLLAFVGEFPAEMDVDHLCRNPACVNPDHLEPVSHAVNVARGNAPSAIAVRTGVCQRGHQDWLVLFENGRDRRQCRQCRRDRRSLARAEGRPAL